MARYNSYGALDDRMLEDLDTGFTGFNNFLRTDQLQKGVLSDSQNGRIEKGEWQTRKGIENVIAPSSTGSLGLVLPFDLADGGSEPALSDDNINQIYGSCIFSDPNDNSESYIILAANSKAIAYKVSNPATVYNLNYPGSITISAPVEMFQAFNKLYIFRSGANVSFVKDLSETAISTSPTLEKVRSGEFTQPIEIVCEAGEYAMIGNRGVVHKNPTALEQGDSISVVSDKLLAGDAKSSGLKIGEKFVVSKTFTQGNTVSVSAAAEAAQEDGGEYDDLYKVTLTASGHTLKVGDPIEVAGVGSSTTAVTGNRFVAAVDGNDVIVYVPFDPTIGLSTATVRLADGFQFFINSEKTDIATTEGDSILSTPVFTKRVSIGLGFSHMPAATYGVYHQRRLAVPYRYSVNDAVDSYTDRKIFDEILISDILDTDTYDQVYGQFRFNAGKSDFNVGMHSFSDDKLIVFNRNSIHIVIGSGDLSKSSVQLLTDEVGLLARKSIVQVGNQVIFLSDNGIYGMNFIDLYNLRGNDVPLSETINETIRTINQDYASNAVATYFDNKYYLAVPTGTSTINNTLLIFNFLNKSWESIDTIGSSDIEGNPVTPFEFSNLLVTGSGSKRGVYVTNKDGGVHVLEEHDDGIDKIFTDIGGIERSVRVGGSVTTRMFTFNSIDRNKFNNFELHLEGNATSESDVTLEATLENVDSTIDLTPSGSVGTDFGPFNEDVLTETSNTGFTATLSQSGVGSAGFAFNFSAGDTIVVSYTVSNFTDAGSTSPQIRGVNALDSVTSVATGGTIFTANGNYKDTLVASANGTHLMFADSYQGSFTLSNFTIVSSGTANIPKGEDVSIRGRFGNPRAYGMKMKIDNILGRTKFRSLKVAGCETYRSTSSVK